MTSSTRRQFLQGVSAAGGYGAAYVSMQALGLLPSAALGAEPLRLETGRPHATRIAILGAGIAGLSAAYELRKAGYHCTVLEARERVGGRNWTVRGGDRIEFVDGRSQRCDFDREHYFNAGPARLPGHHRTVMGYCREFGIPLEVEINTSRSALVSNPAANGGRPIQLRQAVNDTRGAVAELLGKAIDRGALDQELTVRDRERVLAFLKQYGDLTPERLYKGSPRSGWATAPGAGDRFGVPREPVSLDVLLDADLWNGVLFEELIDQQATMFQPVGGMDAIPKAFAKALGPVVRLGAETTEIRRRGEGVRIVYRERGMPRTLDADCCIVTIPSPVLKNIPADFSRDVAAAIAAVEWQDSVKIAWQSRRFWEQEYDIYGGISWIKGITNMVWYPSGGLFGDQGVVLGAYSSGVLGSQLAALPLERQFEATREVIERLHPGHGTELKRPIGVNWGKVPFSLGEAAHWRDGQAADYQLLNRPDGPFWFAGDYLARVGTWQESALTSSRSVINRIDATRRARA